MPYIKTPSGINWHYITRGKGPALLFIHGWAGDFSIWFRQIDFFADKFKVVVCDLPGHGKSDYIRTDFDSLIDDIVFIIKKLSLKSISVLGLSFGGQIAIKLTLKSKSVKKLVLIDSSPEFVKQDDFKAGLSIDEVDKLSRELDIDFHNRLAIFARSLFTYKERQKEAFSNLWDLFRRKKCFPRKNALKDMLVMIGKIDLRKELNKIKIPTLIINGAKDPICPIFVARFLNDNIPNSELRIIDDCGHMPILTEADRVNQVINKFLLSDDK